MSIFQNTILVTLSATESFISLCTFSRKFGRSQTFYLMKNPLMNIITGKTSSAYIEQDLLNFGRVESIDNDIHFSLFWLHSNAHDELSGYQQHITIPAGKMLDILAGETVKHLSYTAVQGKAQLSFMPSANEAIADIAQDKLKRHALRKFFRDNMNYSNKEHLIIQRDSWINGFYFCSSVSRFEGGIALHTTEVTGKDGKKHCKVSYDIHT